MHQAAPERHDEEAEIEVAEGSEGNAVEGSSEDIDEIKEEEPEEEVYSDPKTLRIEAIQDPLEETILSVEIEQMIEQAESEDPGERREAVVNARKLLSSSEALAANQVIKVLEMILKFLKHDTSRARMLTICAIEDAFYHNQVPKQICVRLWEALIALTSDSNNTIKDLAARVLGTALTHSQVSEELEMRVWEALLGLSQDEYFWCQDDAIKAMATALESTQPADATLRSKVWERLLSCINNFRCPSEIQKTVLRSLANIFTHNPPPQEIKTLLWKTLLSLAHDENCLVAIAARNSIETALANNQIPELANNAHWEELSEVLNENKNNHGLRAAAARAIGHTLTHNDRVYPAPLKMLLDLASDINEAVQLAVSHAIGFMYPRYEDIDILPESIEAIASVIISRYTSRQNLSQLWEDLVSLGHHKYPNVRKAVGKAIMSSILHGRCPDLTDIATWRGLLDLINDEDFALGQAILNRISPNHYNTTLWDALISLLGYEDYNIHEATVKALASALAGHRTTPEIYARLWRTLAGCSTYVRMYPEVREYAARGLGHMLDRETARDTLTPELRDAVLNALIQLALDYHVSTREAAANALRIASTHSLHPEGLLEIFLGLSNHEDESVQDTVRREALKREQN